jgi:uncharacterized membrane protein YsdA (DUF1294 family)
MFLYLLIAYTIIINIISFSVCFLDKKKAEKNRQRISEKMLFFLSIIGGAVGMYLAMQIFRHKTQHLKFTIGIPAIIVIQCILWVLYITIFYI